MRIIAGSARRVQLTLAEGSSARPFLEMARGALFNSLAPRLPGAAALDLYAGSGALGLEALSRGVANCVFVERDRTAVPALRANIVRCGMESRARVLNLDAEKFLAAEKNGYDLVFVDPPFPDLDGWRPDGAADGIMRGAARVLTPGGILVFRLENGKIPPPDWPGLILTEARRYGRSRVCRYVPDTGGEQ